MDSIGAEVGLKMRSAIKAKLLELNCYVDDELPDYIMVMVANKRSKSQMNEDLNLFLSAKTSPFVDWLHIVLKKLKEVTVTNPDVYKKVDKQKFGDSDLKIKKEKKSKRFNMNVKSESTDTDQKTSLTDNLLITPNRLTDQRKIMLNNDNFDIPLLSEVSEPGQTDVNKIKDKLSSVKSRLGIQVESDDDTAKLKNYNEKTESDKLDSLSNNRRIEVQDDKRIEMSENVYVSHLGTNKSETAKRKHTPITFEKEEPPQKKISILERLGKKATEKRNRTDTSEFREEESRLSSYSKKSRDEERFDKKERSLRTERNRSHKSKGIRSRSHSLDRDRTTSRRDSFRTSRNERRNDAKTVLSRLGVMSTIHIPQKDSEEPEIENELKTKEVRSMVQVKPRVIPLDAPQANKNLLLKAVAEAHRSVAQTVKVGSNRSDVSPKKYKLNERIDEPHILTRKLSDSEKTKLRNIILSQVSQSKDNADDDDDEDITADFYVPKPLHRTSKEEPKYIPSSKYQAEEETTTENEDKQQIIVTFDNQKPVSDEENQNKSQDNPVRKSAKLRLQGKKSPSPIIFDKVSTKISTNVQVPDKLPVVRPPLSIKNKERCKYWPSCRQGDKCEFVHPNTNCEMFPNCKFGDKCLFLHPICKFGTSCTKKECPYSHLPVSKSLSSRGTLSLHSSKMVSQQQTCKYFPNCINVNCPFYHPKPCKFGRYCKNQASCTFSHTSINTSNLTWRSK